MDRSHYTHSADMIRLMGPDNGPYNSPTLSRANASRIRQMISEALGMDDAIVSEAIAKVYVERYVTNG